MSAPSNEVASAVKTPGKRSVGRPRQVSMEQIFAAALSIGLGNLTLQAVADALGVTPPALYRHIAGREDLIAKFVGAVTERFPVPAYNGEGWANWATKFAEALLEMYAAVPGLADYTIRTTHTGPNVLSRHEMSIKAAVQSGFDDIGALYATRAIIEFVAGWVARNERRNALESEPGHPDVEFRRYVIDETGNQYPYLKGSLQAVTKLPLSHRFDVTLRALVIGLASTMALEVSQPKGIASGED